MTYKLLEAFRNLFEGKAYLHRNSTLGDWVAMHMFEDLYDLGRSSKYVARVNSATSVLNVQNRRIGIQARRGDGSFGEIVPNVIADVDTAYNVRRGPIATIEIGVEVKILQKAMIKQIDRTENDLRMQAVHFRSRGGQAIRVGIVGVNHADHCTSYEGDRSYTTDGRKNKHPAQEAVEAEKRLQQKAAPSFDEFLVLRFKATNEPPFTFEWLHPQNTERDYGAILARISQDYQRSAP